MPRTMGIGGARRREVERGSRRGAAAVGPAQVARAMGQHRADADPADRTLGGEQGVELRARGAPLQPEHGGRPGPERGQRGSRGERLHLGRAEPLLDRPAEALAEGLRRAGVAGGQPREAKELAQGQVGVGVDAAGDEEPARRVDLPVAGLGRNGLARQGHAEDPVALHDDGGLRDGRVAHEPGAADDEAGLHRRHPPPRPSPRKAWGFSRRPVRDLPGDVELISFRHHLRRPQDDP